MRIAAIFATMNRSATAVACVRALAGQTRPPDLVVVADNLSADTTVADLESLRDLPFVLDVIRMPDNAGNAGGIVAAMERAFAREMDAVWILDDDSWPRPEAMAALLAGNWDGKSVRHAHQIDPKTQRFTWPLPLAEGGENGRLAWCMEDLPAGDFIPSRASWTGALVPRAIHDAVGPVNGDLFIRGEDEEYPLRIQRAGFSFFACRDAILDHPGPLDLIEWNFLGKKLFYERGLSDWKFYYKVRNMVWIKKNYEGSLKALLMALAYLAATFHFDGLTNLSLWFTATRDGWQGRLGRWDKHPEGIKS